MLKREATGSRVDNIRIYIRLLLLRLPTPYPPFCQGNIDLLVFHLSEGQQIGGGFDSGLPNATETIPNSMPKPMVRKKSDSIADFFSELKKRNESDTLIDERLAVKLHHETISLIRADRDRVEDRMIALKESFQTDSPIYPNCRRVRAIES